MFECIFIASIMTSSTHCEDTGPVNCMGSLCDDCETIIYLDLLHFTVSLLYFCGWTIIQSLISKLVLFKEIVGESSDSTDAFN